MKHFLYIAALLFCIRAQAQTTAPPLGNTGNTVEVKGGISADSSFNIPWYSPFKNKGSDTSRRISASKGDSLPQYMLRGQQFKMLTTKDSATYYVQPSQKGAVNGVANLDGTGKVPAGELPAITLSGQVYIDNSQTAMLSHSGATAGALSVRTDSNSELFVLVTTPSNVRANWVFTTSNSIQPIQTTLTIGDSTNKNFFIAPNLSRTFSIPYNGGASVGIGLNGDGSGWVVLKDTTGYGVTNPKTLISMRTGGGISGTIGQAYLEVAAGVSGTPNKEAAVVLQVDSTGYSTVGILGRNTLEQLIVDSADIVKTFTPGTYKSVLNWHTLTAIRRDSFPDESGTVALLSDAENTIDQTLGFGDSTTKNFIGLENLLRPHTNLTGFTFFLGHDVDGSGRIALRDTNSTPFAAMTFNTGGNGSGSGVAPGLSELTLAANSAIGARNYIDMHVDSAGYSEILIHGRLGNSMQIDTAHFTKLFSNGLKTSVSYITATQNNADTIPNKSGTFAFTTDLNAYGLNSTLSANPNTNQTIVMGKVVSNIPYSSVYLGVSNGDSTGYLILQDSVHSAEAILSTSGGSGSLTVGSSSKTSVVDAVQGIYTEDGTNTVQMTPKNLTLNSGSAKYLYVNDTAISSQINLGIGKIKSNHPFSSVIAGTSGTLDSSGRLVIQDTSNVTTITASTSSTIASLQINNGFHTIGLTTSAGITDFHLNGNGGAPSISTSVGAGTGGTATVTGTDLGGFITINTGTTPGASGIIANIFFATAFSGTTPRCINITPGNAATSALSGVAAAFIDQGSITTSKFNIVSGSTALPASSTFIYYYTIIQ